jgi:hypothetical protein
VTPVRALAAALPLLVVAAVAALWPAGGDSLVIYSSMGPPGLLIPRFEAETGIRVTYINMGGGPLQARIYAEGARSRWTVAWFVGDGGAGPGGAAGAASAARRRPAGPDRGGTGPAARGPGLAADRDDACRGVPDTRCDRCALAVVGGAAGLCR